MTLNFIFYFLKRSADVMTKATEGPKTSLCSKG